jgi:hypothetical protein
MVAHWTVDFVSAWRQIKLYGLGFTKAQVGLKCLLNALALNLESFQLETGIRLLGPNNWPPRVMLLPMKLTSPALA